MRFEGWTVAVARDGWEAGQEARRAPFDMILLDIRMPYQDGWGVLRDIRQSGPNVNTPVYILTSMSDNGMLREGLRRGADGVFLKADVRPDELVGRIVQILGGSAKAPEEEPVAPKAAPAPAPAPPAEPDPALAARGGRDFFVYVNPFLGDGAELSELLGLPQPFTCPICQGQVCLRIRFDDEGTGLGGGFLCSRCENPI
jgi:CheY-like chemotaxis protein